MVYGKNANIMKELFVLYKQNLNKNFFIYSHNGVKILYDKSRNAIYLLHGDYLEIFSILEESKDFEQFYELYRNRISNNNNHENFMKILQEILQVLSCGEETIGNNKTNNLRRLNLLISQTCAMKCIYCYGNSGSYTGESLMNIEVLKKTLEFF